MAVLALGLGERGGASTRSRNCCAAEGDSRGRRAARSRSLRTIGTPFCGEHLGDAGAHEAGAEDADRARPAGRRGRCLRGAGLDLVLGEEDRDQVLRRLGDDQLGEGAGLEVEGAAERQLQAVADDVDGHQRRRIVAAGLRHDVCARALSQTSRPPSGRPGERKSPGAREAIGVPRPASRLAAVAHGRAAAVRRSAGWQVSSTRPSACAPCGRRAACR